MILRLVLVGLFAPGPFALAWGSGTFDGTIYVRKPFHWLLFALARIEHEIWHQIRRLGNEAHAPFWSFKYTAKNAIRLRRDVPDIYRFLAHELRSKGSVPAPGD